MRNKYLILTFLAAYMFQGLLFAQQLGTPVPSSSLTKQKTAIPSIQSLSGTQMGSIKDKTPKAKATKPVITQHYNSTNATGEKCGSSSMHQLKLANDATYRQNVELLEQQIELRKNRPISSNRAAPYTIPVVFHVMYKNGDAVGTGTNISDAQIISSIDALNRDYQKLADDGGIAQGTGVASNITFCIAQRDPSNNPHTGINRINVTDATYISNGIEGSGANGYSETALKALSQWDNTKYMNVWIVTEIDNSGADNLGSYTGGTLGYAYFPGAGPSVDGVVVTGTSLGNDPGGSLGYNLWSASLLNRTMTHEVGHYLSLFHTFEGNACSETCATQGDLCCDTPPTTQGSACTPGCAGGQYQNYMDYTDESCQNMLTADQQTRMYAALDGTRSGLNASSGCNPVNALDAGIAGVSQPSGAYCGSSVYPVVAVTNYGSTTLTSAVITFNIDGGTNEVFNWSGSLTNAMSENVSLTSITTTAGAHTFNVTVSSPNGGADAYAANDANTSAFTVTAGNGATLSVFLDDFPHETYWELTDAGSSLISSGGYSGIKPGGGQTVTALDPGIYPGLYTDANTTVTESFCLSDGCYDLTFYDDYNDGINTTVTPSGTTYLLEDNYGATLVTGGAFGTSVTTNFCVAPPTVGDDAGILSISNPANGSTFCSPTVAPVVVLKNYGTVALTSVDIYYGFDGGASDYTYSWTGSLASGATVNVTLTAVTITTGNHSMDASTNSPNGTPDVSGGNDAATQINFSSGHALTLEVYTDGFGYETFWAIQDAVPATVAYGGNPTVSPGGTQAQTTDPAQYGNNLTITENICLADGCYDLYMMDDWGDGISNDPAYKLMDDATGSTIIETPFTVTIQADNFCLPFVADPPVASFSGNILSVPVNGSVIFTDESTNSPTSWNWDFGDGNGSTIENPSNTYASTGIYDVCLTVTNASGSDSYCISTYITVYDPAGVCDTIDNILAGDPTYIGSWVDGYYIGHNAAVAAPNQMTAFSDRQYSPGATSIRSLEILPTKVYDGTGTSTVDFIVWTDVSGFPGAELARKTVNYSDINELNWNTIKFAAPVAIASGYFHVGFEITYGVPQDTLGIAVAIRNVGELGSSNFYADLGGGLQWYDYASVASTNLSPYILTVVSTGLTSPNYTLSDTKMCSGDSIYFDGNSSTNTSDWYWDIYGDGNAYDIDTAFWFPYYTGGNYAVELFTLGGCGVDSITKTITVNEINLAGGSFGDISCNGMNDGFVTVTPGGDGTSYSYVWSDGVNNTEFATGLTPGTHSFTITDNNSCETSGSVTITEPAILTLTVSSTSVTSNGGSDGTALATPSGGTTGYTFSWSNGDASANPTNFTAGIYCVTVTDFMGCYTSDCVTITEPLAPLSATISSSNELCNALDGTATLLVSGGSGTYTYLWNDIATQTTIVATGLANGAYIVTIDDGISSIIKNVNVSEDAGTVSASASSSPKVCAAPGSATVTGSNGTGSYTYLWNNSATTAIINGLAAGDFFVTVYDAIGCEANTSVTVANDAGTLVVSISMTEENCGAMDGTATVTASGGTPNYTYLWNNASTTASLIGISSGAYSVTLSDINSCELIKSITVTKNNGTLTATATSTQQICTNLGSVTVTESGGSAPYAYLWNNSETTASVNGLTAGDYFVTVLDVNLCEFSTSVSVAMNAGDLTASALATDKMCATLGSATVTENLGTAPYAYLWDNNSTTSVINNLAAGDVFVTVTDVNGCMFNTSATVNNNAGSLAIVMGSTDETCIAANGTATATASGGTPTYSYLWNNSQTTSTAVNLSNGGYSVTVSDVNGCEVIDGVTVSQNNGTLTASASATDKMCATLGSATVTENLGTAPYTYLWSNSETTAVINNLAAGDVFVTVTDANGCSFNTSTTVGNNAGTLVVSTGSTNENCSAIDGTATASASGGNPTYTYLWSDNQTSATANNLSAGSYFVTVLDINGCEVIDAVTVTRNNGSITASITATDKVCATLGSVTVTPSNGTGTYTYLWNNSATTSIVGNLAANDYFVTIADANGCLFNTSVTVANNAGSLVATTSFTNETCGNGAGSVSITASGGNPTYSYAWSNAVGNVTSISGLSANVYIVTVTDLNSCDVIVATTVSDDSGTLVANLSCSPTSGNGNSDGSSSVMATGGDGNYTYQWSANTSGATGTTATGLIAATYTITVTDGNNCTSIDMCSVTDGIVCGVTANLFSNPTICGSSTGDANAIAGNGTGPYVYLWDDASAQTAQTAVNLGAGTFNVTITDANSCSVTNSVVVGVTGGPSGTITATGDCGLGNGTATIQPTGGSAPYTYIWSNGQNTSMASALVSGTTYSVTISDQTGCSGTLSQAIVSESLSLTFSNIASCGGSSNGASTVNTTGGSGSYDYTWSQGSSSQSIANLAVAAYSVTVDDGNGCVASSSTNIVLAAEIIVATSQSVQTCGSANGSASVSNITGGNSPFTYRWNDPSNQTGQQAINLISGNYNVTVTDISGCSGIGSALVFNTGNLGVASIVTTKTNCYGDCTGIAVLSGISGGVGGYSYKWSDPLSQTETKAENLCAGIYTVTVGDAGNCKFIGRTTITSPDILSITPTVTNETCGNDNASISLNVSGGTITGVNYSYLWSNGNITSSMNGLDSGSYSITVIDSKNCKATTNITLSDVGTFEAAINVLDTGICVGDSIKLTASGGTGYYWVSSDDTTAALSVSVTGDYICYVNNGICIDTVMAKVGVFGMPTITVASDTNNICPGQPIKLTAVGATNYDWSNGATTAITFVYPTSETVYSVSANNYPGCGTSTSSLTITPDPTGTSAIATSDVWLIIAGTTVNFDGSLSNAETYGWDFNGDGITDSTGATTSHTFTQNGIYEVVLTTTLSSSLCIGTDTVLINVGNIGINEADLESSVNIYPNPTRGNFTIDLKNQVGKKVNITIHNTIGDIIYSENNITDKTMIDLNEYATGIYYIRINSDNAVVTKKISLVK